MLTLLATQVEVLACCCSQTAWPHCTLVIGVLIGAVQLCRDYHRAMQEAELLGNFVRLADSMLVAAVAAQARLPLN